VNAIRSAWTTAKRWNRRVHPWQLRLVVDMVAVGVLAVVVYDFHWLLLAIIVTALLSAVLIRRGGLAGTLVSVVFFGLLAGGLLTLITGRHDFWYTIIGPIWAAVELRSEAFRRRSGGTAQAQR